MAVLVSATDIDKLGTDPVQSGFVVSPHRALYDGQWRTATIAELREELARLIRRERAPPRRPKWRGVSLLSWNPLLDVGPWMPMTPSALSYGPHSHR